MESDVLRRFYSDIQRAITNPIGVASLLHQEDVVDKVLLDEVSPKNKVPYSDKKIRPPPSCAMWRQQSKLIQTVSGCSCQY